MFIKKEKKCSAKLVSLLLKYFLFLLAMLGCAALFLVVDAWLKTQQAKVEPEVAEQTRQSLKEEREKNMFNWSIVPDYNQKFNITTSVRWTDMFHIVLIQIILMSWCFYYQFTKAVQARKKLIYVEVHAFDNKVKRR